MVCCERGSVALHALESATQIAIDGEDLSQ